MFWKIFSSICIPVTIPWLCFKFIKAFNYKRKFASLSGKVVLITGASSGLGEALAHAFYSQGCKVVLAARRKDELERVKNDLMQMHATVPTYPPVVVPVDLSELNSLPGQVSSVLAIFGHIDILINNGGISYRGGVNETNIDVDIKVMLVNYFGQVALTKAVLPMMLARGCGHIVAVSSVQGRIALPNRSAYAASKHALQAFSDTLRAEVSNHGIKVTVVSPGYIQTKLSLNALTGSGQTYGVMDTTTANGYESEYVAREIVKAVVNESPELVISQLGGRFAIVIRTFMPSLYFWIMSKRAKNADKT
ncbi:uncharacterized protein CBL_05783 [Carabus blaptoides fortunei]